VDSKQKDNYQRILGELDVLADSITLLKDNNEDLLILKDKLEQIFILQKEKDKIKKPDFVTKKGYKILDYSYKRLCKRLKKKGLL